MAINFTCPQCGKQTVVADQFAGQTGPCSACGAQVTVPLAASNFAGPTTKSGSGGASIAIIILGVLAVMGFVCAGLAFLLLLPAVSSARSAARRAQSMNNLKQLGLALHNYHDLYNTFPPAVVTDADGKPLYSGRVLLLPFLEQASVYQNFDKSKAWNSPENQAISATVIKTFQDPAHPGGPNEPRSDYVFVTGTGTVFDGNKSTTMAGITDGTANTIVMVQTAMGPKNWAEPVEWNADNGAVPAGNHPNVVLVLFADGSVRGIPGQAMQGSLKQLTQRADGMPVPNLGY